MAPPGRRRNANAIVSLILSLLLLLPSTVIAQSVVLGIDLGTEYIKAALVKPGIPLEIVLSKDSKRKEASAVAFKTPKKLAEGQFPERSYGPDALALAPRFPGDVYPNLKPLLGLPVDGNVVVENYAKAYPALDVVQTGPRNTIGFRSPSFRSEDLPFAVEEILAMELKNVKENAQALAGKEYRVENAVFTIPPFYTAEERKALKLAAELAGLKVLGLVSDGLAVGINYATTRTFPSINEGGKPEQHMVIDVGAGSTTATVLRLQGRTVKDVGRFNKTIQEVIVLGTGWDRTLGGDALNHIVVADIVEKFVVSPGVKGLGKAVEFDDVRKHGRTAAKLWREAERVRQVLSANQETVASFEGLYEDVDFKYKLSRTAFEAQAKEFAERLEGPIKQALKLANLTFDDIDSIILHGGASRTPFVQKKLEALSGDASKLRSNVNADEAAVFGAAFKAARLSPSFRVKEIVDRDAGGYGTWLRWKTEGKEKNQKLFQPSSSIGMTKQVAFHHNEEDFSFTLYQSLGAEDPAAPKDGAASITVTTTNLTKSFKELTDKHGCKSEDISHVWSMRLDPTMGLPEVIEGSVRCEALIEDKKGGILDDAKGFFGFGKKDDKQQVLKEGDASSSKAASDESATASPKTEPGKDGKPASTKEASSEPTKKIQMIKIAFEVTDGAANIPPAEVTRMKERLAAFDASDKARRAREEDLNNLESFTYKVRDYLSDDIFDDYLSKDQKAELEKLQQETSEWLSEGSHGATSEMLKEKLKALRDIVNPALKRKHEASRRPELITLLEQALNSTKSFVQMMKDSVAEAERAEARVSAEAAEAAKSASESASSASEAADTAATDSSDPLADLEEDQEPVSPTDSSDAEPTPSIQPVFSPYSSEDLKELSAAYESVNEWLEGKLKAQEGLQPHEDPAFDSRELERNTRKLNEAMMNLFNRRMAPPKPPKPKTKTKSKGKGKTTDKETATSSKDGSTKASTTESAKSATSTKDEL